MPIITSTDQIAPIITSTALPIDYTELFANRTIITQTIPVSTTTPTEFTYQTQTLESSVSNDNTMSNFTESSPFPTLSPFDWSSILNNDSEKTIYESFNELLDNSDATYEAKNVDQDLQS